MRSHTADTADPIPSEAEIEAAKATLKEAEEIEAKAEAERHAEHLKTIETWLGDCFKLRVTHFVHRDGESVGYNAHSMLDFGRDVESTMFYSATFENGVVFHFGIGAIRQDSDMAIMLRHPDGATGFLCMNRIPHTWGGTSDKAYEASRAFWVKSAKLFKQPLKQFEKFIADLARELCDITGFDYDPDNWRAPIKKRVVKHEWE